ncbi:DUF924 family protein [Magnetococcus sp. PR-3]|uniref:DUF924 family protein n=1 Tax=Magnetococcus sp. PR-3 TaxID=3120355 RepID=UPI002FCE2B30
MRAEDILTFWFETLKPVDWFRKSEPLDQQIVTDFMPAHEQLVAGELVAWRDQPAGWLAQIILLDQFSRNMFRGSPQSFAYDALALFLAQQAIHEGIADSFPHAQRTFIYMPYMHSESLLIQKQGLILFATVENPRTFSFAQQHHDIIARFGRFPHRNALLGRASSAEEQAFLQQPGSSF